MGTVRQTFDRELFTLKLSELSHQMQIKSAVSDRKAASSQDIKVDLGAIIAVESPTGRAASREAGGSFLLSIVDGQLALLRDEWLAGVDRIAREVRQIQGEAVTPEFVRETLLPEAMMLIGARESTVKSNVTLASQRTHLEGPHDALHHLAMEIRKLKREVAGHYEIEARELEYQKAPTQGSPQTQLPRTKLPTPIRPLNTSGGIWPGPPAEQTNHTRETAMKYPGDFPAESRAKVEVARIRAGRRFDSGKAKAEWNSDIEALFKSYVLTMFLAFANEAWRLRLWPVDKMRENCQEFLRLLSDWTAIGGKRDALLEQIRAATEWKPALQKAAGFVLTHLGDLLSKPDTPIDWVLQNVLVAGGVSGVFAKPKVGKSTFCRNLCLAVARGGDFLGFKTKQGECVYLALEEREDDVRNDFRSLGADGTEPIYVHAASAPADGIDALCDLVRQRRPVLVVIDPLFRLARIRDEKAYAETYAALGPLIDIAREVGTHVLLSHHAGKGMKADAVDSPLGSTAIGGVVSTLVILRRNESMRTIQTVQRVGADLPETVLRFDPETHRLSLGGTRFEADRQECEGAILDFLRESREPQTQVQIREGVQGKTATIRAALTELVRSQRVLKSGDGTKGKPFLYAFENSGSNYMLGTKEPESLKGSQAIENKERMLVPENSQDPILVPSKGGHQKRFQEAPILDVVSDDGEVRL